jgi:hypothetical protein
MCVYHDADSLPAEVEHNGATELGGGAGQEHLHAVPSGISFRITAAVSVLPWMTPTCRSGCRFMNNASLCKQSVKRSYQCRQCTCITNQIVEHKQSNEPNLVQCREADDFDGHLVAPRCNGLPCWVS